jgi:hypothetical protein
MRKAVCAVDEIGRLVEEGFSLCERVRWKSRLAGMRIGFIFFPMADGRSLAPRSAGERKVRTPQGSMPRRTRGRPGPKSRSTESVAENKPPSGASRAARVKRRGKSPPPRAQARGHEKPHAVQDRTGRTGSPARSPRKRRNLPGIGRRSARNRRRCASPSGETNDRSGPWREPRAGQNPAYSHHPAGALRKRGAPGFFWFQELGARRVFG